MPEPSPEQLFINHVVPLFRHHLEPYGFRYLARRAPAAQIHHDFYLEAGTIGKLLVVNRGETPNEKELIFSILLGLFSGDYWTIAHNGRSQPVYPTLSECLINKRLAQLLGKLNLLFTIRPDTNMAELASELDELLATVVLPYFASKTTVDDLLGEIAQSERTPTVARMRLLHQLGRHQEARQELQRLIASRHQAGFRQMVVKIAKMDGLLP